VPDSSVPTIVILLSVNAAILALLALGVMRVRTARIRAAERVAAESARNAEIAAMTRGLAHEIKNPLSTVSLNAQLLREEILDAPLSALERERMVRRVDALAREASRLSDVLNDFLRYAGRLQLDPRVTDLRITVRELADFFAPQAEQAGVTARLELPDSPVRARVDEPLVKQVLLNLMLNAVQAMERNPAGAPRALVISARELDARERREHGARREEGLVQIAVRDTGPGVPADLAEQIFQPYVTTRPGGNGLGLATARRIVEAHGGRIEVRPAEVNAPGGTPARGPQPGEPGAGARFVVTLPIEGPPERPTTREPHAPPHAGEGGEGRIRPTRASPSA
jgi:signal transduction histidine kinase